MDTPMKKFPDDSCVVRMGDYKPGIHWYLMHNGEVWLEQNPASDKWSGRAAKHLRWNLMWVLTKIPLAGQQLSYKDPSECILNGRRLRLTVAKHLCQLALSQREEVATGK